MRSLEQLDRWIAGKVKNWTSRMAGAPRGRELLEIRREILEDVRDRIEALGEGRCLFPYNTVAVRIVARDAEERQALEAAALEQDIAELLKAADCAIPEGFTVSVAVLEDAAAASAGRPFQIGYSNRKAAVAERGKRPPIKLTVLRGEADAAEYSLAAERVNLGRLKEVLGEKEGLRRINDVAFADTETTVSREHAYIRYDLDTGKFRVYDSGSQRGTSVYRDGRRVDVPRGPTRGVQLQAGDEIHLGEARVRFEVG